MSLWIRVQDHRRSARVGSGTTVSGTYRLSQYQGSALLFGNRALKGRWQGNRRKGTNGSEKSFIKRGCFDRQLL